MYEIIKISDNPFSTSEELRKKMANFNMVGNIIPHTWFKTIRKNGKPYTDAIIILSEIVYWYRPVIEKDEKGDIKIRDKFHGEMLQLNYSQIEERLGITHKTAARALKFLEELGVIKRIFATIKLETGSVLHNVMFISLNFEKLRELTEISTHTYGQICPDVSPNLSTDHSNFVQTNTKTTTEITTNINNSAEKSAPVKNPEKENKKEKVAVLKDKTENSTCEDTAADLRQKSPKSAKTIAEKKKKKGEETDERVKKLKIILSKIYAKKYTQVTGLNYTEFGKLMKLTEKAAKWFIQQYDQGIIKSPENLIFRAAILVNFMFKRGKTDPVLIFGKTPEMYAELKAYSEGQPFYKKYVDDAYKEAEEMVEELPQLKEYQEFLNLFEG